MQHANHNAAAHHLTAPIPPDLTPQIIAMAGRNGWGGHQVLRWLKQNQAPNPVQNQKVSTSKL